MSRINVGDKQARSITINTKASSQSSPESLQAIRYPPSGCEALRRRDTDGKRRQPAGRGAGGGIPASPRLCVGARQMRSCVAVCRPVPDIFIKEFQTKHLPFTASPGIIRCSWHVGAVLCDLRATQHDFRHPPYCIPSN
ncbi:hypothetical protein E2C01_033935 [Portunus trituberculatus]|uniref:Uncharacterized protein n=1 Tax=Portunus trituberculatus TaxID=210409 RepID=A0A5B7F519_PORTR|nr:hypothetical protein [Portunus trituberculatus]